MIYYLNNQNGTGYCYSNKERFLNDLREAIEELTKDGATYIDVSFESNAEIRSDTNVS